MSPMTSLEEHCDVLPVIEITALSPAQMKAGNELLASIVPGQVYLLRGAPGKGKTAILRWLQVRLGGVLLGVRQFLDILKQGTPAAIEEAFLEMLDTAIDRNAVILVDDLHLITAVVQGFDYPRSNLLNAVINAVLASIEGRQKTLIFATEGENEPKPLTDRASIWRIEDFGPEDFSCIISRHLGACADQLDFENIHRFAPALNAHQMKNACLGITLTKTELTTEIFIEYLRSRNLVSNVELEEVQSTTWADLKGMDDVIEELEAKIALPFNNDELALSLDLKPKRGVLLAGPPGTGKTTIGRALAQRLKSKFFLIDGTINAAEGGFYDRVAAVFEAAKRNAPSVIFIDDADVILEDGNRGFYRYLLTMMDGLESATSGQVCVVLTAMDATVLPAALLRSGRVELWLTTRLPDERAREAILVEKLKALPPPVSTANVKLLARNSKGLSGADLKSVVEEGKLLYAYALATGRDVIPVEPFFLRAIHTSLANRRNYGKGQTTPYRDRRYGYPVPELVRSDM